LGAVSCGDHWWDGVELIKLDQALGLLLIAVFDLDARVVEPLRFFSAWLAAVDADLG
jgi:hypothetical protein